MRSIPRRFLLIALIGLASFLVLAQNLAQRFFNSTQFQRTYIQLEAFLVRGNLSPNQVPGLPDLRTLYWPPSHVAVSPAGVRLSLGGKVAPLPKAFEPVMSAKQRELCRRMLNLFTQIMFENGMGDKFMLYGGTLIGSFRHHDFIPWDDDLDLLVDVTVRSKLQTLLDQLTPEYHLTRQPDRDKFHTALSTEADKNTMDLPISRRSSRFSWGWPYLDIAYYRENETHISEIGKSYGRVYAWPKSVVFPLRYRPFGQSWYPSPYRTAEFLRLTYGEVNGCQLYGYSHVLEGNGPNGKISCEALSNKYAFVQHKKATTNQVVLLKPFNSIDPFILGEERLILRGLFGVTHLMHTLYMPILESETGTEMYGFG